MHSELPFSYRSFRNEYPFNIEMDSYGAQEGSVIAKQVSFASPRGGRVTSLLAEPLTGSKHPGVLSFHFGGRQTREGLIDGASRLAEAGMASLFVDAPWLRPEQRDKPHVSNAFELFEHAGTDLLRAAEVLSSLSMIDEDKLAYVGHGFGAHLGAPLAALSKHIRAAVLIAGSRRMSEQMQSDHPFWQQEAIDKNGLQGAVKRMTAIDAEKYLSQSRVPVFHQFANQDHLVPQAEAQATYQQTAHPKVMRVYEGGHGVEDPRAFLDRLVFLKYVLDELYYSQEPDMYTTENKIQLSEQLSKHISSSRI